MAIKTTIRSMCGVSAFALLAFAGNATAQTLFGAPGNYTLAQRGAFGVLDLRAGLQTPRWSVTAFANNALDRRYLNEVIPAVEFGGSFISPGARALYGVELGFKF